MSDAPLQKRDRTALKEKGQYLLAFGVVASVLYVAQFPIFVIFFFGIFAYFLLRIFSSGSRSETREIFEFYLTANEMLRDDERRWYGFEINDAIRRGEDILHRMNPAPPLVYFSLGALQNKVGNHKGAISNLSYVVENDASNEASYVSASPELQSYVRVLRKIEREPTDAPLTSAAVRALERARKLRAKTLLEDSRHNFSTIPVVVESPKALAGVKPNGYAYEHATTEATNDAGSDGAVTSPAENQPTQIGRTESTHKSKPNKPDPFVDRKSISEVLHDIYDKNVQ